MNVFYSRAEHIIKEHQCLPYFYPEPPAEFFSDHHVVGEEDSIFCNIAQLQDLAKEIHKYSAMGQHDNMVQGKVYNMMWELPRQV